MPPSVTLVRMFDRSWAMWRRGADDCRRKPTFKAVHALRIGSRRMAALLDVLAHTTQASPKALRRLTRVVEAPLDALSSLRDDQVQRRRASRAARADDGRGMDDLLEYLERRETRHKKRAHRGLARLDLTRAEATAQRVRKGVVRRQGAPTPAERTLLLLTAVDHTATEVRSRLARLDAGRPRTIHRLRLALKRFRYAVEIAQEMSPNIHVASPQALRALQRRLGRVHDADVFVERIDRFVGRSGAHREGVRAFRARLEDERARSLRGLSRALTDLAASVSSSAAAQAL
jgi:CHAD domain-containing protein